MGIRDFFLSSEIIFWTFIVVVLFIGVLIGIRMAARGARFFNEIDENHALPFDTAAKFRDNFAHRGPLKGIYPKTDCVVHDYAALIKYLTEIESKVFKDDKHIPDGYTRGVSFYFGKSHKKDCVKNLKAGGNGPYPCILKKNYTVFLYPALYKSGTVSRNAEDVIPIETSDMASLPPTFTIEVLTGLNDPFHRDNNNSTLAKFIERAEKITEDDAFDLGHTHP